MALNKTTAATDVVNAIDALVAVTPSTDATYKQKLWEAILNAVFSHIQNNMEVIIPSSNNNPDITTNPVVIGAPVSFISYGTNPEQTVTGPSNIK